MMMEISTLRMMDLWSVIIFIILIVEEEMSRVNYNTAVHCWPRLEPNLV